MESRDKTLCECYCDLQDAWREFVLAVAHAFGIDKIAYELNWWLCWICGQLPPED